eukprot:scaffold40607_cov38-Cyclotella_meneghiniana.AAC.3
MAENGMARIVKAWAVMAQIALARIAMALMGTAQIATAQIAMAPNPLHIHNILNFCYDFFSPTLLVSSVSPLSTSVHLH